ncbi:octopamine receptor beta-2R-like [Babylonia areolata]|uniref:octopamine receptor beta-2R-like n=1 Tax=Babylonia areolata TaxID=304850 RepID=UPI003FD1448A
MNAPNNVTEGDGVDVGGSDSEVGWDLRTVAENAGISFMILLISVIALLGNIIVILAVYLYPRLREEVANLFIVNLSVTDLCSAVVVMLTSVVAVANDRWVMGDTCCALVCGANYCFIIVSMLTLCMISLDRYVAVNHSLRYHTYITKGRVQLLIAYTWLQGLAFGLAPILYDWIDYDYWEVTCAIQWHLYGDPVLTYVIIAFILCFLLPSVILGVAYGNIFNTTKKIEPRPQPATHSMSSRTVHTRVLSTVSEILPKVKFSATTKAVRSLLVVVLAYFICMTPFSVTKLYKVCVPAPDSLPGYASTLATIFQYMGSAVNPLIYGLFRRDFRAAFVYVLCRRSHRGSTHSAVSRISGMELHASQ